MKFYNEFYGREKKLSDMYSHQTIAIYSRSLKLMYNTLVQNNQSLEKDTSEETILKSMDIIYKWIIKNKPNELDYTRLNPMTLYPQYKKIINLIKS